MFRQLLLAQLVQREELSGEGDVLKEAAAGQLHSDDDLTIGHHHGHVPELNLKFWTFHLVETAWTHFTKFRQFCKIIKVCWQFWYSLYKYLANFFSYFGNFYAFGQIKIAGNGQILKYYLDIWSHSVDTCALKFLLSIWKLVKLSSIHLI